MGYAFHFFVRKKEMVTSNVLFSSWQSFDIQVPGFYASHAQILVKMVLASQAFHLFFQTFFLLKMIYVRRKKRVKNPRETYWMGFISFTLLIALDCSSGHTIEDLSFIYFLLIWLATKQRNYKKQIWRIFIKHVYTSKRPFIMT